jgi:tetratricopeptide (TPR) repeat protein
MTSDLVSLLPAAGFERGNQVIGLEAPPGGGRRGLLRSWLLEAEAAGTQTWFLPCGFADGGPWAGVRDLFARHVETIGAGGAETLRRHAYELVRVLPHLRESLGTHYESLTDSSPPHEQVRNYPADRAFRLVHGLVDLFMELHREDECLVLACDDFDAAGAIAKRFFVELLRRSAGRLRLTLMLAVSPGQGEEQLSRFPDGVFRLYRPPSVAAECAARGHGVDDPERSLQEATELEARVLDTPSGGEFHLPALIRLWLAAGRPDRALRWLVLGLAVYNVMGVYEESVVYGEQALEIAKNICPEDARLHWRIVTKLYMSYLALQRGEEALAFFTSEAPRERYDPYRRSQICYSLAMAHARYLPQRDLARGEELLAEGLLHLEQAEVAPEDYYFQYVFNRNGLAMIRQFQKRPEEAIALCREGYALLQEHLQPESHRLHRSVLVYNMAQVYASMGAAGEAIEHFTAVIAMDPQYSEYYNDRGNLYLRLSRFTDALTDYQRAIALSPPYAEVYTNLGQCHRQLGQMDAAVEAYSRALDLQPDVLLALLGRAQANEALGRVDAAVADYSAALEIDPGLWEALQNRGILHYGEGRLAACLADLDAAIQLAPGVAQLYENRSIVLADLGRNEDATADLQVYLRSAPPPDERAVASERLAALAALPKIA